MSPLSASSPYCDSNSQPLLCAHFHAASVSLGTHEHATLRCRRAGAMSWDRRTLSCENDSHVAKEVRHNDDRYRALSGFFASLHATQLEWDTEQLLRRDGSICDQRNLDRNELYNRLHGGQIRGTGYT